MTTRIAFSRLDGGKWGVKVQGGPATRDLAGQTVEVRKRDGSTNTVKLGTIVKTSSYNNVLTTVYTIEGKRKPAEQAVSCDSGQAEYAAGVAEVAQIQAISEAGSEYREALYMEMEMRNYNLGLDG